MGDFSILTLLSFFAGIQSHFHHQWNYVKKWLRPWVVPKGNSSYKILLSICSSAYFLGLLLQHHHKLSFYFSQYYLRFKSCCEAYNILRKSSSLILNLFKLMGRSNIPDLSADQNGDVKVKPFVKQWKNIWKSRPSTVNVQSQNVQGQRTIPKVRTANTWQCLLWLYLNLNKINWIDIFSTKMRCYCKRNWKDTFQIREPQWQQELGNWCNLLKNII